MMLTQQLSRIAEGVKLEFSGVFFMVTMALSSILPPVL